MYFFSSHRHTDRTHKLVRWRFVFNECIVGFSRYSDICSASITMEHQVYWSCFWTGVESFGLPLTVYCDLGMENTGPVYAGENGV